MKDYYRILEVHPDASPEVITRAYRTLAQKHHPDRYHSSDKTRMNERMQELNEAYETLSDESRRRRFDRQWKSYQESLPARDKQRRRAEALQKLVYGFLLALFIGMLIRGGVHAFMMNPVVKVVMLAGLIWVIYGLAGRKGARQ